MILQKLSDDEVKPLDVPESWKCITCVKRTCRYNVHVGSQNLHAVYSVNVQIMKIKDAEILTQ